MIGKYEKQRTIGSGTFGEAWLVRSVCSGRNYVMKEIKLHQMSEDDIDRTKREVSVLARCKHVNIVRYKDNFVLSDPAAMCLVMEYADGGDLHDQVKSHSNQRIFIPQAHILHWFIQVLFAVQYLHNNNILHRDLKTQNIFLTKTNIVKVGDFGISRTLRGNQDLATTVIGTPYYLSPEICLSKPYNHKSDMWALGCILYELCSLRHPFEAENFEKLVVIILKGYYAPVSLSYTPILHHLISVLLRSKPENRPSAEQLLLAHALKPFVNEYMKVHEKLILAAENQPNSPAQTSRTHSSDSPSTRECGSQTPNKQTAREYQSLRKERSSCSATFPDPPPVLSHPLMDLDENASKHQRIPKKVPQTQYGSYKKPVVNTLLRSSLGNSTEGELSSSQSSSDTLEGSTSMNNFILEMNSDKTELPSVIPSDFIGNRTYVVTKL